MYQGPEKPALKTTRLPINWQLLGSFRRATEIGDVLVIAGANVEADATVVALDVNTGEPKWKVTSDDHKITIDGKGADLFSYNGWTVDDLRGGVVVEEYYFNPCRDSAGSCPKEKSSKTGELGLVALSVKDGSVVWSTAINPSTERAEPNAVDTQNRPFAVVGATPSAVVVNIGTAGIQETEFEFDPSKKQQTIGLDPKTGKTLWTLEDTLTQFAVDNRVMALKRSPGQLIVGKPVILDATTGREVWQPAEPKDMAWVESVPGLAVLRDGQRVDDVYPYSLKNLTDESGLQPLPKAAQFGLRMVSDAANGPFAAWESDGQLWTQGAGDPEPLAAVNALPPAPTVDSAGNGYVWVSLVRRDPVGGVKDPVVQAVDRTGELRSDPVPGTVWAITARHLLLLARENGDDIITIWRYE